MDQKLKRINHEPQVLYAVIPFSSPLVPYLHSLSPIVLFPTSPSFVVSALLLISVNSSNIRRSRSNSKYRRLDRSTNLASFP
ncbi:hypothetical protein K435DRAFT_460928 [Dendrothele bispora CBS 962.96]|uniref:Uncharacterized protein n=1 Tax=Dendrothele bispora (strain CBS 962.96) TaxID=1314807 RepID=A0A4S8L1C1_DENBC|nr:hypothetical protein K435DRAFT_460928 [Dendrothele bispora CBS 962.96]